MGIENFIHKIKTHPDYSKAGMILCHNGVVRGISRDGRAVTGLKVQVDHEKLNHILTENKRNPGIIDILVEIKEDSYLSVGDDVMFLVVAGDVRENVIRTMQDTIDAIKSKATKKTEYFKES